MTDDCPQHDRWSALPSTHPESHCNTLRRDRCQVACGGRWNSRWCWMLMILVMMGIAFCGYVLPWGLMSFWALTVITNLVSVVPLVGQDIRTGVAGLSVKWGTCASFNALFCAKKVKNWPKNDQKWPKNESKIALYHINNRLENGIKMTKKGQKKR